MPNRAHLITGGYPIGSTAGHDMDYARIELLRRLYANGYQTTVANDFTDIGARLAGVDFLVTYVAGPYPDDEQSRIVDDWLAEGGKWFALHGTSGGRAKRVDGSRRRKMVRLAHHDLLGRSSSTIHPCGASMSPSRPTTIRFSTACPRPSPSPTSFT